MDAFDATISLPTGFRASGIHAGVKKEGALDLGLLLAERPLPIAALWTTNRLLGAHVHLCRDHLARTGGTARAILVNSGNANCATGQQGIEDARTLCRELAERLGCNDEQVLMVSTGVIGARLPVERLRSALDPVLAAARADGGADFARAIMTTDTAPKASSREGNAASGPFTVTGFAKGAGMIHPDMATMLAFLVTDHATGPDRHHLLRAVADRSFHRLSVDGDTSPNDTLLLWSHDQTEVAPGPAVAADPLEPILREIGRDLARRIAGDGEGASRLVTVQVRGAADEAEATLVGRTIATSPLVKTAVAGRDPNWGRILSAAGRCGVPFDAEHARVWVGPTEVYSRGTPLPDNETAAARHLTEESEVILGIDLARGQHEADVWTCDLTADYVRINADYRT